VISRERGEDDNMPLRMKFGKGIDIIREDFFGTADRKVGREKEIIGVFTNLGNEAAI